MPRRARDYPQAADSEYETFDAIDSDSSSELETLLQHNKKHRKSTQKHSRKSKGKNRQVVIPI